jgi:hypothetical protein
MNDKTSSMMNTNVQQQQQQQQAPPRRRRALAATSMSMAVVLLATLGGSVGGFTTPMHKRSFSSRWPMMTTMTTTTTMKLADPTKETKTKPELSSRGSASGIPAGSALSMICEDQQEFEMKVGHAMDVLRTDYPRILTCKPGKKKKRVKR